MKLFGNGNDKGSLQWNELSELEQLNSIAKESFSKPVMLFKHSTRCAISSMAKSRLERGWDINGEELKTYYLDLLSYRGVSNEIASKFGVEHQSPQVILLVNGKVTYHSSHGAIDPSEIKRQLDKNKAA